MCAGFVVRLWASQPAITNSKALTSAVSERTPEKAVDHKELLLTGVKLVAPPTANTTLGSPDGSLSLESFLLKVKLLDVLGQNSLVASRNSCLVLIRPAARRVSPAEHPS